MNTAIKEAIRTTELALPQQAPAAQLPATVEQVRDLRRTDPVGAPRAYPAKIARAILAISREIGHVAKRGENTFQRYKYAKWEDVVEALSPLLAEHGIIMVQSEKSRHLIEDNDKGSTLSVVYGFSFVSEDGELWPEIEWTALARLRDQKGVTDDKAATKCHTQAEKYFCMKQFKIRTEEDDGIGQGRRTLPKKDARESYTKLQAEIDAQATMADLKQWGADNGERINVLPTDWQDILRLRYQERLVELRQHPPTATGDRFYRQTSEAIAEEAEPDADGVIWDDPPDGTVAEQPAAWSTLPLVQQAGIRCGDPVFWEFLRVAADDRGRNVHNSVDAAGYVRLACGVKSRALLSTDEHAAACWRALDTSFIAWKHADISPTVASPASNPAVPSGPSRHDGAAGEEDESARIALIDVELTRASEHGMVAFKEAWDTLAPADKRIFEAAKDRRFKPAASKADKVAHHG
jgi:hypothetical protein